MGAMLYKAIRGVPPFMCGQERPAGNPRLHDQGAPRLAVRQRSSWPGTRVSTARRRLVAAGYAAGAHEVSFLGVPLVSSPKAEGQEGKDFARCSTR
jgi:hypothetical protein